jgi:hypothetical protein
VWSELTSAYPKSYPKTSPESTIDKTPARISGEFEKCTPLWLSPRQDARLDRHARPRSFPRSVHSTSSPRQRRDNTPHATKGRPSTNSTNSDGQVQPPTPNGKIVVECVLTTVQLYSFTEYYSSAYSSLYLVQYCSASYRT